MSIRTKYKLSNFLLLILILIITALSFKVLFALDHASYNLTREEELRLYRTFLLNLKDNEESLEEVLLNECNHSLAEIDYMLANSNYNTQDMFKIRKRIRSLIEKLKERKAYDSDYPDLDFNT